MKLGMSSYSLAGAMKSGEMTILDVIDWTADHGGQHVEIVPFEFSLIENPTLIKSIVEKAKGRNIAISNYAVGAEFLGKTDEQFEIEIERVKKEVDVANALGVKTMRHDLSFKSADENSVQQFEKDLPKLTRACQVIADYAKQFNIITSIENHGFYIQASDRVQRLMYEVNRPNFKTTLDTGNFLCVDEDPVAGVKNNIQYASMIHVKDFYYRPSSWYNPGEGWMTTKAGNYIRGSITGHGDIDIREIIKVIKQSGYDGYISIEFEGLEMSKEGARMSLENMKKLWNRM